MFHALFEWIQNSLGAHPDGYPPSWSQQFLGSLNLWSVTEGTHVLTLMLFAGTIWVVDLRMMGAAFKSVPFSKLNDRVLPFTILGFAVMIITGIILFLAKPMDYYHNIWFRGKMLFLLIAAANIYWFHHKVQKSQDDWDAMPEPSGEGAAKSSASYFAAGTSLALLLAVLAVAVLSGQVLWAVALAIAAGICAFLMFSPAGANLPKWLGPAIFGIAAIAYFPVYLPTVVESGTGWLAITILLLLAMIAGQFWLHHNRHPNPPMNVKVSALISMSAWILIIIFGRFIAYNWFECGKPQSAFTNIVQECSSTYNGAVPLEPEVEALMSTGTQTAGLAAAGGE